MRLVFFHCRWIGVLLLSVLITSSQAQSVNDKAQTRLESLWENVAPSNFSAQDVPLPLWQLDLAQSSADSVNILVADKEDNKSLFIGANGKGPGRLVQLPALAIIPSFSLRLFTGSAGQIWIAGTHNYRDAPRTSFGSPRLSDAYLAEFDSSGKVVWEHNFAGRTTKTLHDLAAFPDGDVIVVGNSNDEQWLARISVADARVVWERTIGLRYAGAVAVSGDTIVVAGFDAEGEGIWRFNATGEPLGKQIIEKENVERFGSVSMRLFVGTSNDELYVFSARSAVRNANQSPQALPLKVAKLNQGQLVWRKDISQATLQGLKPADPGPDNKSSGSCFPPIFGLLASGDPLIACPTATGAVISRISSTTGELKQVTALWPRTSSCLRSWPKLIVPRPERRIWLFGTGGCTWLDQISLAD
jgi:hypothetical protein